MKYFVLAIVSGFLLISCNSNNATPAEDSTATADSARSQSGHMNIMDSLDQQIAKYPQNSALLARRAKLYLAGQNIPAARKDINHAIQIDSNVAEVHAAKGELNYMLNHTREARNEWEKCLKLNPDKSDCIMPLAELYIAVREYDKALKLVDKEIKLDDNDARAYFMKGIIVRDKNQDTALALQYFQNAIDINQDYVDALDMMAVTLAQRGDTLAKYYYNRILKINPNNSDTYFKLGVYYMNQGDVNKAIESYTKAVQINPHDADSYYNLAYLYVEEKDYHDAAQFFTKAIDNQARNYKSYYGRGYCYEMMGDVIKAKKDYEAALKILPMYKPAHEALARIKKL